MVAWPEALCVVMCRVGLGRGEFMVSAAGVDIFGVILGEEVN